MKIMITRRLDEPVMDALAQLGEISFPRPDRALTRNELLCGVADAHALVCMLSEPIDAALMDAAPGLRVIANYAVGYNNIDLAAAKARDIAVVNTPGVLTDATAELAWALLLAAARRVPEGDALTRSGNFSGWSPRLLLGQAVTGTTLGVVGAGRIGTAFALMSRGFGMKVLYTGHHDNPILRTELNARRVELDELLSQSDFISLHVPLTEQTRHLIDRDAFSRMKPHAVLVNTARGAVVDEVALVEALTRHTIAAAGLDVYEREPKLAEGLSALPNVVLLPHLGSATVSARRAMGMLLAKDIQAVFSGNKPSNRVI